MLASNCTFYLSTDGDFQSLVGMFNLQRIYKIHSIYKSLKVNLAKII